MITTLDLQLAQAHLSEYLAGLGPDDRIVLCTMDVPVAEVRPIRSRTKVRLGLAKGQFTVPEDFTETPASLIDLFHGAEPGDAGR